MGPWQSLNLNRTWQKKSSTLSFTTKNESSASRVLSSITSMDKPFKKQIIYNYTTQSRYHGKVSRSRDFVFFVFPTITHFN